MSEMKNLWGRTGPGGRAGLVIGVVVIVIAMAVLARWAFSKQYQVLFTELAEQDAATLIAELDRMKVPYRLEAGGRSITVPEDMVHKTRLQLVGKSLPLHGSVGFEIFNNTDFGMTEFNQRVNYQRALQGELTRTIMSLEEVQSARVHLVLPESTLFKREQNKPKASITLAMRPGQALGAEQVLGIQRLVTAAVPGIEIADVVVLDQKGHTLSRRHEGAGDLASWQLQTKLDIEDYLARKGAAVLDRAYGPGQGLVSVDVQLNFDQVKTTTEEVLGARGAQAGNPSGVVVRERQTVREAPVQPVNPDAKSATPAEPSVTQSDVEYQTGRRVEQIVTSPGSMRRINVAVVLPKGVPADRGARVRELVAAAVGLDEKRGDSLAVQSLDQLSDRTSSVSAENASVDEPVAPSASVEAKPLQSRSRDSVLQRMDLRLLSVFMFVAAALALLWGWRRRPAAQPSAIAEPVQLGHSERQLVLENVQRWLSAPEGSRSHEPSA